MYQSIGGKPQAPRAAGCKHGKMQGSDVHVPTSRQKKARVSYEQLDLDENLSSGKSRNWRPISVTTKLQRQGTLQWISQSDMGIHEDYVGMYQLEETCSVHH